MSWFTYHDYSHCETYDEIKMSYKLAILKITFHSYYNNNDLPDYFTGTCVTYMGNRPYQVSIRHLRLYLFYLLGWKWKSVLIIFNVACLLYDRPSIHTLIVGYSWTAFGNDAQGPLVFAKHNHKIMSAYHCECVQNKTS